MTGDGGSVRALADQFRELVMPQVEAIKKDVKDLSLEVKALTAALAEAKLDLPERFMSRYDCQLAHVAREKLAEIQQKQMGDELGRIWVALGGKMDKATLAAGLSTGKIIALSLAWLFTSILASIGTAIALANLK